MISFASRRRRRTKYYRYCQYARSAKSLPRAIGPEDVRHLVRLTRVVRDGSNSDAFENRHASW